MPLALVLAGAIFAILTALSHRPPDRPGALAVIAWMPAWLVSELPIHALAVVTASTGTLAVAGGLAEPAGWAGVALAAVAAVGLVRHVQLALRSAELIDDALHLGLGGDHAARAARDPALPPARRLGKLDVALVWPIRPRAVERVRNVCYHRHGRRRMCLDVYRAADPARRRPAAPVFLYVHGGAWVIGNKSQQGRVTVHRLADAGWICVSIDYRLSPGATFPDHICDVKRAIAWVREHIAEHGGDPGFVVIGGGSAGAHLASLAALTPNALEYQRELPDVDTSVQGCVAFYGVYDLSDRDRAFRHAAFRELLLERIVMKRRFVDAPEEFERASPRWRIGGHAPPFMILHGSRDSLAPVVGARRFRDELRAVTAAPVVWVELPGAQHAFELFPSLRSTAVVDGVERFCATIHADWRRRARSGHEIDATRASDPGA
jgi:acetyl esterase/lipase